MTISETIVFMEKQSKISWANKQKYMEVIAMLKEKQAQEERICLSESVLRTIREYLGVNYGV